MASTFHVSIPEHMEKFIEKRVREKSFKTRGTYVQELIRQDQLRSEKIKLTNLLLVGLASKQHSMNKSSWNKLRDKSLQNISIEK